VSLGVLLALGSALSYGLSDFLGGLLSRRTSAWGVALVAQSSSALCTLVAALFIEGSPHAGDFAWALLAGVGSGTGACFLYRGFAAGRMSVVGPVSAVGAALLPVLVGALTGERPSLVVWLGVVAALPGIWLVSSTPPDPLAPTERRSVADGLVDGVLAGLGFGLLFAALGQVPDTAGWWPLSLCQAVSVPSVLVLAAVLGADWVPRGRSVGLAALCGPLGAAATGAFLVASQRGYLTVAAVLTSLYPASTVLLAAAFLHERIHRAQGVGLGLCAVAVACVAGG
jgi:drug/metabolite transporter (DMT)-like permease